MNKFILLVALVSVSFVRAVDDDYIKDSEQQGREAGKQFTTWFKEKNKPKQLPKVPAEKSASPKPILENEKPKTRPMPIILEKEEKPAIVIDPKKQPSSEIDKHEKSRMDQIGTTLANNKGKIAVGILALGIIYLYLQIDQNSSAE